MSTSEEPETPKLHYLKDPWGVFYIPIPQEGGKYETHKLDTIDSLEAAFAVLNTMPQGTILPQNENLVFSRNGVEPTYENFNEGVLAISIYVNAKNQGEDAIARVIAASLGESFPKECGEKVVQVVRIAHKPSQYNEYGIRIDVWLTGLKDDSATKSYLKNTVLITVPGCKVTTKELKARQ